MTKKEKIIAAVGFALSVFLFLCALINLFSGHIAAAICSLGSGIFFCSLVFVIYKKGGEK